MKDRKVEILAPAGGFESLMAAIQGGADAIYFGVEQLNMRARATMNFTLDDLEKVAEICKDHHIKSYLTLNTVIFDHDLPLVKRMVNRAKAAGIDAIIASDHAVISYVHEAGMTLHISTQCNVSNIESVRYYARFADTIVLARELSLSQASKITAAIEKDKITGPSGENIKIEIFVHGALCMAVSGKCYLSLHTHNASANRGACVQNCRHTYEVKDRESGHELAIDNEYIMSAKDLCTIDFLDRILEAGVKVLKIEGRSKGPEYVKTVTQCYREAVDAWQEGTYTKEKVAEWTSRLENVYNRGFWSGYYMGQQLGEWTDSYGSKAKTKKVYIGKSTNYYKKLKVGEFLIENGSVRKGDSILITGPSTGVIESVIEEIHTSIGPVEEAIKGELCSIKSGLLIRKNDKLYKVVSEA